MDKTKAIHSPKHNGYIHKSNVIYTNKELYHKQDTDIVCLNNKWYHISQCFINYDMREVNRELAEHPLVNTKGTDFYVHLPKNYMPYYRRSHVWDIHKGKEGIPRKGNLIPKEYATIMYNLVYNPIVDNLEYQKVYCVDKDKQYFIQLITGEYLINSSNNKQHLKKFNNEWYIKREFKLSNKNQLTLFGNKR